MSDGVVYFKGYPVRWVTRFGDPMSEAVEKIVKEFADRIEQAWQDALGYLGQPPVGHVWWPEVTWQSGAEETIVRILPVPRRIDA